MPSPRISLPKPQPADTCLSLIFAPGSPLAATVVEADEADTLSVSEYVDLLSDAAQRLTHYLGEFRAAAQADIEVR